MSQPHDSGSPHCTQPCIGRRAFVERSIGAVLGTSLLTACASLVTRTVTPVDGTLRLALVHYPELAADGGSLKVIPKARRIRSTSSSSAIASTPHCRPSVRISAARSRSSRRVSCVPATARRTIAREGAPRAGEEALASYRTALTSDGVIVVDLTADRDA
jgi:hypothetical protein